ncbi:hypothetical protein KY289_024124 [Solanum tuberosum]|nr:hypothetical protein KY289_024124 [Solanum tuberosum]
MIQSLKLLHHFLKSSVAASLLETFHCCFEATLSLLKTCRYCLDAASPLLVYQKYQGEKEVISDMSSDLPGGTQPRLGDNPYRQMVLDAAGSNFGQGSSLQCYRDIEPESSYH